MRSRAPYGYGKARIKDGARKRVKLALDPAASQVVRHIFDMAASRRSTADIATTLNSAGIPTRSGGRWTSQAVRALLANEAYTGTCGLPASPVDGVALARVEGAWPAIVTPEELERAQHLDDPR